MPTLYIVRHAQSQANALNLLAGQQNFPLTEQGQEDALAIAQQFCAQYQPSRIISSPLLRASQTAQPFSELLNLDIEIDPRIIEQNMGRFSGMSYPEAEADPDYETDRSARWHWIPAGDGESYEMMAERTRAFLTDLLDVQGDILVVTHAVTMRLLRANLEHTLPRYPEKIAANGEVWKVNFTSLDHVNVIESLDFGAQRQHRA